MIPDPAVRRQLTEHGYTSLPLLSVRELDQLRQVRRDHGRAPGDPGDGLFNDTWSTDVAYKRAIMGELGELMGPAVARVLPGHRPLGFVHIVKWPGDTGTVVAHRDPTFVDEDRHRSLMVWCALEDLDVTEGALWVVPGSHADRTGVRIHQSAQIVHPEISDDPGSSAVPLPLSAGEAIIYDHALIHCSGPNRSTVERVAVSGPVVPRAASLRYAVPVPDGGAEIVRIDESFFVDHRLCALEVEQVLEQYPRLGKPKAPRRRTPIARRPERR